MRLAALTAAAVVAASPAAGGATFLGTRELPSGGFAEQGATAYPQLTAWSVLGLRAAGRTATDATDRYLSAHERELTSATDLALAAMAERDPTAALARLRALRRPSGSYGALVNGTAWAVIALRGEGRPVSRATIRWLLARQTRGGGWGWNGAPDSNDTAAVVQALRATGATGKPIRRALAFLLTYRNRDGGFELTRGRGSDAQSTAWAVQAFLAARRPPPRGALAYLRGLQRPDGSFRYSRRYATTPVWVTAQVLPALARKPFPLRR